MAEDESEVELDRFKEALESLLTAGSEEERGLQSKFYCSRFCELVEEYTGQWHVPLPQLQVLRRALCAFVRGAASFPSDCEHVRYTLSSLALSIFELLLFFGKDEFPEDPLKDILDSFQECHSSLVRYQNVYLLQVRHIIRDGGPWTSPVLEGILKGEEHQQDEVDRYLSSEVALFFELRVRYLLACERTQEAMALARRCSQHSTAGRRLYFKQAYLSCLWKTSQRDVLLSEMAEIDGKDAVEILCIAETEEKKEFLLELSRGFLLQQLSNGDMYHLWDLVFIWCKLYLRVKTSRKDFLEECKQLLQSATNVKTIFPFVKVILSENLGKEGLTFCVELCAHALQTDLKNDPVTKSLIYKTLACLFPHDLEICRACALLVFFLERSVEAYKTVFLLYNHPDQDYQLDSGPIENNIRFEVIQILKKGLFFDPEFWSLVNIKTNCLKLMSDEVASAALCEIMEEDKWVPNYCARGQCTCRPEPESEAKRVAKRVLNDKAESADSVDCETQYRTRGQKLGSLITKDHESSSVRRSFRHLDGKQNHGKQLNPKCHRFLTRHAEKFLKRRGRRPRWLVEQLAAMAENNSLVEVKKSARSPKKLTLQTGDTDVQPGVEITTEYSYPDNEVEVPANIQGLSTSKMTGRSDKDKAKVSELGSPERPCSTAPDSPRHTLLEKSAHSWRGKGSDGVQSQEMLDAITNFHTYATVTEDALIRVDAGEVGKANPPAVDKEQPLERLLPLRNFSEPMKVYTVKAKVTSQIAAVEPVETQRRSESSLVPGTVPDEDSSEHSSAAGSVTDSIHTPGSVDRVSTLDEPPAQTTDCNLRCENASREAADRRSTSEIVPKTSNTTVEIKPLRAADVPSLEKAACSPENLPDFPKEGIFANLFAIDRPESPPLDKEAVKQQTTKHELPHIRPPENSSPTLAELVHCCKLCNKEYRNSSVLQHALWHYRTEKKCIFCPSFTHSGHPLCHFKKHIKDLRKEEQESVALKLPRSSERENLTEPKVAQKKPMPGLAQIKSKLLMRLKLKSKPSTRQEDAKNSAPVGKPSVDEEELTVMPPQIKDTEQKDQSKDRDTHLKEKIRYVTRGVARKSDPQGRFLRTRLSRKAKSRGLKEDDAKSLSKEGPAHKANGVLRKKPKLLRQKEVDLRAVKEEIAVKESEGNKTDACVKAKQKAADGGDIKTGLNCSKGKLVPESGLLKKKRKSGERRNAAQGVKKSKASRPQHKAGEEHKDAERENGKEADEKPLRPQKKKDRGPYTVTLCPVVGCGFQARANPLLAHVLFHHAGDITALEFCYSLLKNRNCVFCSRIIWSFQHFSDHMVSHQGKLKHLCYHVDCTERFETRLDLSEHMLKAHHPLKAGCCYPECKMQFNSLKFLYSHERFHYKPTAVVPKARPEKVAEETPSGGCVPRAANSETDARTSDNVDDPAESTGPQRNNSPVSCSNKSPKLVNGHSDHEKDANAPATPAEQKDEEKYPTIKPFVRPPPSAYLDELSLCMPKRWKGTAKSSTDVSTSPESKRHSCSRCSAAFDGEEQLQLHREKCTSLFGFDSDDENAF